ncbi:hypothetical protein HPB49_011336 [Dermacentor silvarum]|uniref:Uncharacterized protein n=1 Tax=Dermacentor silvarum TaxID=543639 RepID=A0ACB8DZP5_DERSI|nr:hypothetical protein HPB49_011336 [Dermacentor silvarum]
MCVDGAELPEHLKRILQLGPKFCHEPASSPTEKLAMARGICRQVPENVRLRCTQECIQVLKSAPGRQHDSGKAKQLVDHLTSNLCLLQSDKEGMFVAVPEEAYLDKARTALAKNFIPASVKRKRIKDRAMALLEDLNLNNERHAVRRPYPSILNLVKAIKDIVQLWCERKPEAQAIFMPVMLRSSQRVLSDCCIHRVPSCFVLRFSSSGFAVYSDGTDCSFVFVRAFERTANRELPSVDELPSADVAFDDLRAAGVSIPAGITFEGFADADKDLELCAELTDDEIIRQVTEDSDDSDTENEEPAPTQPTSSELTRATDDTVIGVQRQHDVD